MALSNGAKRALSSVFPEYVVAELVAEIVGADTTQTEVDAAEVEIDTLQGQAHVRSVKVTVDCSEGGAAVATAIATVPINAIILDVVAKVTTALNGDYATDFEVGVTGNIDKYIDNADLDETDATDFQAMTGGGSNDQGSTEFCTAAVPIIATWTNQSWDYSGTGTVGTGTDYVGTGTAELAGAVDVIITYVVPV